MFNTFAFLVFTAFCAVSAVTFNGNSGQFCVQTFSSFASLFSNKCDEFQEKSCQYKSAQTNAVVTVVVERPIDGHVLDTCQVIVEMMINNQQVIKTTFDFVSMLQKNTFETKQSTLLPGGTYAFEVRVSHNCNALSVTDIKSTFDAGGVVNGPFDDDYQLGQFDLEAECPPSVLLLSGDAVVDCGPGTLVVAERAGKPQTGAGSVVLRVPEPTEDACPCNAIARRVTAKTRVGNLPTCPGDAVCYQLTTVLLKAGELLGAELLDAFNINAAANEELEPLFGCAPVTKRALAKPDVDTIAAEAAASGHNQRRRNVLSNRADVPLDCDAFSSVDAAGRCLFSGCSIKSGGDPNSCLVCGTMCDNGCGAKDDWKSAFIPTRVSGVFDFTNACCTHDKCYSSDFSKLKCDLAFLRDMLRSCVTPAAGVGIAARITRLALSLPLLSLTVAPCPVSSLAYWSAVALGGDASFGAAQTERNVYEQSATCAFQCPTTQTSGGQGLTSFSIDLLTNAGSFPVEYEMFTIPDELTIEYEGGVIFSTGGLVSGSQRTQVAFQGQSTVIRVTLNAPLDGTAWQLFVGCPVPL